MPSSCILVYWSFYCISPLLSQSRLPSTCLSTLNGINQCLLLDPSKDKIKISSFHSLSSPSNHTASLIIHWIIAGNVINGGKLFHVWWTTDNSYNAEIVIYVMGIFLRRKCLMIARGWSASAGSSDLQWCDEIWTTKETGSLRENDQAL